MESRHAMDDLQIKRQDQFNADHGNHYNGAEQRGQGKFRRFKDLEVQEWMLQTILAPYQNSNQNDADQNGAPDDGIGPAFVAD